MGYKEALECFLNFDGALQNPYFHPDYIVADAARDKDLTAGFFVYKDGGRAFYHGFHLSPTGIGDFYDVQSAYGYGGPLSSTEDPGFLQAAWDSYDAFCRGKNILAEFIRFHPLTRNWRFYGGDVSYERKTVWLDLKKDVFKESLRPRARTAVRKARQNGLTVKWVLPDKFLAVFPKIYRQTMTEIKADGFYFFGDEYFSRVAALKDVLLAVCELGGETVAAAIFIGNKPFLEYHLSAAAALGKKLNAVNLILFAAAETAKAKGYAFLHIGGGTDNDPANPLLFFKESFSKLTGDYKIGRKIYLPSAYARLKGQWEAERGREADKTLFYRF